MCDDLGLSTSMLMNICLFAVTLQMFCKLPRKEKNLNFFILVIVNIFCIWQLFGYIRGMMCTFMLYTQGDCQRPSTGALTTRPAGMCSRPITVQSAIAPAYCTALQTCMSVLHCPLLLLSATSPLIRYPTSLTCYCYDEQ